MKERHLIVLRPNQYNDGDLRLGLLTEDYRTYVEGKNVKSLYVNFYAVNRKIPCIKTYINKGSIVKKSIINTWLHLKGFSAGTTLLFELTTDDDAGIHIYSFLGTTEEATAIINHALDKIR